MFTSIRCTLILQLSLALSIHLFVRYLFWCYAFSGFLGLCLNLPRLFSTAQVNFGGLKMVTSVFESDVTTYSFSTLILDVWMPLFTVFSDFRFRHCFVHFVNKQKNWEQLYRFEDYVPTFHATINLVVKTNVFMAHWIMRGQTSNNQFWT